jgi:lysophospholipase L1-like esterase
LTQRWFMLSLGTRLIILALAFFGAMGALEWWAREHGDRLPHWGLPDLGSEILIAHPTRLWGLAPGQRENVETIATVSQMGLRGDPPTHPRSQDEERIVILGDSGHFGHGVSDEETMSWVLQKGLLQATVINGGVPGYSTEQTLRLLDEVIWDLEPTVLVLGNFWSDTNFEPFSDKDLLATRDAEVSAILIRSALMRWVATSLSRFVPQDEGRIITWGSDSKLPEASHRRVKLVDYVANLEKMIRAAAKRNVGVLLLSPPSKVETTLMTIPPHQWTAYKDQQKALSAHYGVPYMDASLVFAAEHKADPSPNAGNLFMDDLHPTARGHVLVANLIKKELREAGWPLMRLVGGDAEPVDLSAVVDTTPRDRIQIESAGEDSPLMGMFLSESVVTNGGADPASPLGPDLTQDEPFSIIVNAPVESGPFQVHVRYKGRVVASIRSKKPGKFPIKISTDTLPAIITARNAKGQQVKQTIHDLRSSVELDLP